MNDDQKRQAFGAMVQAELRVVRVAADIAAGLDGAPLGVPVGYRAVPVARLSALLDALDAYGATSSRWAAIEAGEMAPIDRKSDTSPPPSVPS